MEKLSKRRTQSDSGPETPSDTPARRLLKKTRYRIVVMGAAGVGKTCIISRLLYEQFLSEYKATVEELHSGEYELDGMPVTLDILDTSGAYEFPAMRRLSITTGDAFILVYSVDDEASFDQVERLRDEIIVEKDGDDRTPIVIVGNKTDLGRDRRRVHNPMAETTASIDWGTGYIEVSAKDDVNIAGIFTELLAQARLHVDSSPEPSSPSDTKAPGSTAGDFVTAGLQALQLRRRNKQKLAKRTSCHVS